MTTSLEPAPLSVTFRAPSRRSVVVALTVGLVVAVTIGVTETRRVDVAPPPVTASAEDVVRAHLAALDAGDLDTAVALVHPAHAAHARQWYDDVISIRDVRVEPARLETPPGAYPEQAWVRVYFDKRERPRFWRLRNDDIWGYLVARAAPGERWVITGEGKI